MLDAHINVYKPLRNFQTASRCENSAKRMSFQGVDRKQEIVGKAEIVHKETGRPVKVVITREIENNSNETYKVKGTNGETLGYTNLSFSKEPTLYRFRFGYKQSELPTERLRVNGRLHVHNMKSYANEVYKGIGTVLHQVAVERSHQLGLDGRVDLSSIEEATFFHYLFGFRPEVSFIWIDPANKEFCLNPRIQSLTRRLKEKLALKKSGKTVSLNDLSGCGMYLPVKRIMEILNRPRILKV